MHGTVNEAFEGRKLATAVRSNKVVLNMRDVLRFASWGMSEWMDFLRVCSESDLYLVECSTYAVSQLNIVTGLIGHAKLVSFYASYRCASCTEELQTLFLIPRDRATIRNIPSTTQTCPTCKGSAMLEEYPAAFFDTIADRPAFDIDDEVLAFMRSHLKYDLSSDLTRFRAYRRTHKDYTYLRLTGNLATLPPEVVANACVGTTVIDLEHVMFDPSQVTAWRTFLPAAIAHVKSLQLINCPPRFLETALQPGDLRDKLKVRTFGVALECGTCGARTTQMVDVAAHLEELVQATVPSASCSSCRSTVTTTTVSPALAAVLSALPARDRDVALDSFITKSRAEPVEKLEICQPNRKVKTQSAPTGRGVYLALGLSVVVVGALAVVATKLWNQHDITTPAVGSNGSNPSPLRPTARPEWIVSDVPASGYCQDLINRFMCVGVSAYTANKDDGVAEASDAALEELVSSIGLKIADPFFKDTLVPTYNGVRAKAFAALQTAEVDRTRDPQAAAAYAAADETVRKVRKRVVDVLRTSGGAAVPAQRSDWYWEEYEKETGKGTEFLVFVRFDVPLDSIRALVERYSMTTPVLGGTALTAFPALAWPHPKFTGGALLTTVNPALAGAGIAPRQIVVAVGDQRVTDAAGFAKAVEGTQGELKLTVEAGDAPDQVISVKR